jgi:hypothetical protein
MYVVFLTALVEQEMSAELSVWRGVTVLGLREKGKAIPVTDRGNP